MEESPDEVCSDVDSVSSGVTKLEKRKKTQNLLNLRSQEETQIISHKLHVQKPHLLRVHQKIVPKLSEKL